MAEETPVITQYLGIKKQHPNDVLFFRLGDFYEMFGDEAREVVRFGTGAGNGRCGALQVKAQYHVLMVCGVKQVENGFDGQAKLKQKSYALASITANFVRSPLTEKALPKALNFERKHLLLGFEVAEIGGASDVGLCRHLLDADFFDGLLLHQLQKCGTHTFLQISGCGCCPAHKNASLQIRPSSVDTATHIYLKFSYL